MAKNPMDENPEKSPFWSPTTKLVIGLTLAAIAFGLFVSFRAFLGPIFFAVIISYLFYPWAIRIHHYAHIPWRITVTLMYLLALIGLISLVTWGGITLVEQIQNLITFLQGAVANLPDFIAKLTAQPQLIGPFTLDWAKLDVVTLLNQALAIVQPILAQAGTLVGTIAGSAASIVGWTFFAFILSYFIVSETHVTRRGTIKLQVPGYTADFKRIGQELTIIWNAFLRGQLLVFLITTAIYTCTLGILGVRYYFGLALLAGLGKFLPYIGPVISLTTDAIVSLSQGYTIFGLQPQTYALIVVATAWISDAMIDNFISPRIFSNVLKIHPAAVMVTALVAFNFIGIIGMVLAAPVIATVKLIFDYIVHKLLDMDPWADFERTTPPAPLHQVVMHYLTTGWNIAREIAARARSWWNRLRKQNASD